LISIFVGKIFTSSPTAFQISSSVFATTAANGEESSYACYFDNVRRTYLGDVYSVMWMEDSDAVRIHFNGLFGEI
jgi:hypothetical protein